ncbi:uncharacterized protein B0H18DRAFT_660376 [Fomitopsis serialis]|uniref:uncharacterized protein n=1 Tax=Fomitopsis serialis TaxID=139415 RepID=UPI0020087931|nr:uncharacterized protein B0H18DRAFT_660376 [Neoantrodia serialis]KAH9918842.1 hypothetical protein B0H18DRAFT_660376 [Neoantrodia serialis]
MAQAVPEAVISEGPKKGQTRVAGTWRHPLPPKSDGTDSMEAACNGPYLSDKRAQNGGDEPVNVPYPNLFAVGDAVGWFGVNNAGRNSYHMAEVAGKNTFKLIERPEGGESQLGGLGLDLYEPGPLSKAIGISLGMVKLIHRPSTPEV